MASRSRARAVIATLMWSILLPCALGAALCVIGSGYGSPRYFIMLRWAVSGLSAWMLYVSAKRRRPWLPIGFGVMLIVFNPYLPLPLLDKPDVRELFELLAATWFVVGGLFTAGHALRRK